MAWVAAREGARLAADALGDQTGSSIPFKAQEVATPRELSRLINAGTLQPDRQPVVISTVQRQSVPSVSSNCHNLVLTIEQAGESTLPRSLFVKLPMEALATRWFFSIISVWRLESYFFRHVAHTLPLRTPLTYATRCQGTRFYLVQENLHEDPDVELFTNPDMLAGPSLALVYRCMDTFARLHACHYGLSAQERENILPLRYHLFLSPTMGSVSRMLNRYALNPCMKKQPGVIPAEVVQAYQRSIENWDTLLQYWFSEPLSLLHGDSHLGNFFVSGDEMGMLDWQAPHWGKGIRDVQYFLIDSLPVEVLAAHERELVAYYVQRRGHYGAAIDLQQTWQEYRSFTFHTLMTIVVSIGFGAMNKEQDVLMGMLDWQAPHWGKGIRDVQYFLIDSLPADVLAAHERELVEYYVQRRAHYGAAIDLQQTWQEYRSFTFHTLMTIVVSIGFGAMNKEQDVLMGEILRRAVAAVQRVDYAGWLRDYLTLR